MEWTRTLLGPGGHDALGGGVWTAVWARTGWLIAIIAAPNRGANFLSIGFSRLARRNLRTSSARSKAQRYGRPGAAPS